MSATIRAGHVFLAASFLFGAAHAGGSAPVWRFNTPYQAGDDITTTPVITDFCTTLELPDLPSQQTLLLWPGMSTTDVQLTQFLLTSDNSESLGPADGWCASAYQLDQAQGSSQAGIASNGQSVPAGQNVTICYHWDGANVVQTGTLTDTGAVLSTLTEPSGPAETYYDTTITLNIPAPNLAVDASGATPSTISSSDGGKTYDIPRIDIVQSFCQGP
ncbi:MAG: hypothetical protein Q9162_000603 [Coniocarpon cinnabarinum]